MKAKFAGFLRRLLGRTDDDEAVRQPAPRPATAKTLVMPSPIMPPQTPRPTPRPQPAQPAQAKIQINQVNPVQPAPQPVQSTFTTPGRPANEDELQLPLQPIIDALPMELRARVKRTDTVNLTVVLPLEKIIPQLALGTVRITFGELRRAAAGVFSDVDGGHDQKPVALPLNEILMRLNPSMLSRRLAQKHIEVSEDITGPFGGKAQGLKISPPPAKPAASPMGVPPARMITPVPAAPAKIHPPSFPARSITPASPTVNGNGINGINGVYGMNGHGTNGINGNNGNGAGQGHTPITPIAPETTTPDAEQPPSPPLTMAPTESAAPISSIASTPAFENPPPIKMPQIPVSAPAPGQPSLPVPLSALLANWPEALKLEIVQLNLSNAQVALPLETLEAGLKRGRVTFFWRELRALIKPTPPATSIHDPVQLDLPLHVIAPMFLSRQNGTVHKAPQKTTQVEDIPNLFFGDAAPAAQSPVQAAPPAPVAPPPQPVPITPVAPPPVPTAPPPQSISPIAPSTPLPPPPPVPIPLTPPAAPIPVLPTHNPPVPAPVAKLPNTNFFQRNDVPNITDTEFRRQPSHHTDFLSRGATPKEVVERATVLEGVAGAIVALPDGLKVASKIPPELNADTLAAFLPQLYGRVNQCSKELRMGELNNLNFTVGNVPWKIFRVNAVYFAAFGRAGQALPTAQLAMLATELDRKRL